jgi:hypothetical protein
MRQPPRTRLVAFAVAAVAVAVVASVIAAGAARDGRGRRPPQGAVSGHFAGVVGAPVETPTRPRPELHVLSGRATDVARRFAAAWRAWDAGQASPRDAAVLQHLTVAGLWQRLRQQQARPTAERSPKSLALHSVHAVTSGPRIWRAALIAHEPNNSYLGTLLVVATPTGPRVADVQR